MSSTEVDERSPLTPGQFEGLKNELERLLVKNRGLTRLPSPDAAQVSACSSDASQQRSLRDSNVGSSCSASLQQSSHRSQGSVGSSRPFSDTVTETADSSFLHSTYLMSSAECASQQLNRDVDLLLKQVNSVMGAPVLQLPAWFARKSASPSCTVTELQTADSGAGKASTVKLQHKVLTPKIKASFLSPPKQRSQPSCSGNHLSLQAPQTAAMPETIVPSPLVPPEAAAAAAAKGDKACSSATASSCVPSPQLPGHQPDNMAILLVACSVSPTGSQETPSTTRGSPLDHRDIADSPLSPAHWHTNHLAERESSDLSLSPPSDDHLAASVSRHIHRHASADSVAQQHMAATHRQNLKPSESSGLIKAARHSPLLAVDEGNNADDQAENVAPGWHRQPLSHVSSMATRANIEWPHGKDNTEGMSTSAGLLDGYVRGTHAKLQLPAAVRMGSRKTSLSVRTPLKSITEVYRQHSMDRFDAHKPQHAAAPQTVGEPLPGESPSERTGLPSAQIGCPQAKPFGRAESMAGQVEGLQAVLQDSSAALQQELMTAEARMEAVLSQLASGRGAALQGDCAKRPCLPADSDHAIASLQRHAERQDSEATRSRQQLEAKVLQLAGDLQHCTTLLSRSEDDLQTKTWQLQQLQAELTACSAALAEAEQKLQANPVQHERQQLEMSHDAAAGTAVREAHSAAAAQAETQMLREQLHDSVELLDEAEQQLRAKVAEVDEYKASLQETQQELEQSQQQLQEAQLLVEEHAKLLQQHNKQLLQAHEEVQSAERRHAAAEARHQAEVSAHADTEQQLRSAVNRLQMLAQQGQPQPVAQTPSDGRLQAAQARCDRAEGYLIAQQGKTQQVSRQLASKCAELVGCQTELHQVHHMLAAAYAANAALQLRFRQRGSSMTQMPEQLPASPLITTPSSQSIGDAVTPQASLQAPGTGTPLLLSDHTKQHSLAAALARAARNSSSVPSIETETRASLRADERQGPSKAGPKAFGWNGPLAAEAAQASDASAGFQLSGSHTAGLESARQSSRAGSRLHDRHVGVDGAAAGRQDDVTSSASFNSWNSRQHSHNDTTASTSHAARHTTVHPSLSPAAGGTAEAMATTAASAQLAGPVMSATGLTSQATTAAGSLVSDRLGKQGYTQHTQWLLAQVQQAALTPGSKHSTRRARAAPVPQAAAKSHVSDDGWRDLYSHSALASGMHRSHAVLTPPATPVSQQGSSGPSPFSFRDRLSPSDLFSPMGYNPAVVAAQHRSAVSHSRGSDTSALATALAGLRSRNTISLSSQVGDD
ncbi:hypothetical protein WJX77_003269 [Trebouxia sp. C0004]